MPILLLLQLERPDQEEVEATMKETQAAMDALVSGKVMAQQPKTLPAQPGAPTYLKYKPLHSGPQHNSGAEHRIIKMQDMPVDPMEPPKFRHKKVRRLLRAYPHSREQVLHAWWHSVMRRAEGLRVNQSAAAACLDLL